MMNAFWKLFAIPEVKVGWREVVWLCLPALLIGAVLRISLMTAIPEGYYGADSNSYFGMTKNLWVEGEISISAKRRWIYPLLLVPTPLLPGRTAIWIAAAQHLLGLATIFGIGWIVAHLTRHRKIWVPAVTVMAAMWPRMLWYEHEIIAEGLLLASFVFAVALVFPINALKDRKRLFWFIVAMTVIVAVKPHGRPFWLGLMGAAVLIAGNPLRWGTKNLIAAGASFLILLSAGSSSQGNWLLLSSVFPLVKTEGKKWEEYRAVLRPQVEQARADLSQYPWIQNRYKKMLNKKGEGEENVLGPLWADLLRHGDKFSKVASDLSREAILSSPLAYTKIVLLKIGLTLADDNSGQSMIPRIFWARQNENNDGRWEVKPAEMKLVYELEKPAYYAMTAERSTRKLWFEDYILKFTKRFTWTTVMGREKKWIEITWFGGLMLFGLATCFVPGRFRETSVLWLPALLYMGIIFAVGDSVSRYLQPVEWTGLVFIALGLDFVLNLLVSPFRKKVAQDIPANA